MNRNVRYTGTLGSFPQRLGLAKNDAAHGLARRRAF